MISPKMAAQAIIYLGAPFLSINLTPFLASSAVYLSLFPQFTRLAIFVTMASLTQVALVLLLCLVVMQQHSDFVSGYGYSHAMAAAHSEVRNRKVLNEKDMDGWELRSVPSGPDPLHHNANPKKPRTP